MKFLETMQSASKYVQELKLYIVCAQQVNQAKKLVSFINLVQLGRWCMERRNISLILQYKLLLNQQLSISKKLHNCRFFQFLKPGCSATKIRKYNIFSISVLNDKQWLNPDHRNPFTDTTDCNYVNQLSISSLASSPDSKP